MQLLFILYGGEVYASFLFWKDFYFFLRRNALFHTLKRLKKTFFCLISFAFFPHVCCFTNFAYLEEKQQQVHCEYNLMKVTSLCIKGEEKKLIIKFNGIIKIYSLSFERTITSIDLRILCMILIIE